MMIYFKFDILKYLSCLDDIKSVFLLILILIFFLQKIFLTHLNIYKPEQKGE